MRDDRRIVPPEAHARHVFRRVRGMPEQIDSLVTGIGEPLKALLLDRKGSMAYALVTPPEVVMMTLNRMMAEMQATLLRHDALVSVFRCDGFFALLRGTEHAARAVAAGLELRRRSMASRWPAPTTRRRTDLPMRFVDSDARGPRP